MTPEQQTPASVVERLRENLADSNPSRLVCVESGDLQSVLDAVERLSAQREGLRDCLLGIALSDRYRRYPKQHEDGGVRGQSGLRAVRALTGKHGSYLNDDEVVRLDKEARAALTQGESRQTGWEDIATVPFGERVLIWVTGKLLPGARFGSAYRGEGGKVIAKPEGGNGDWTKDITHWQPLPAAPTPADGGGE
jgi:hypothetical protein